MGRGRVALVLSVAMLLAAACQATAPTPTPARSSAPSQPDSTPAPTATLPSPSPTPTAGSASPTGVDVDATLLDHLPPTVDGLALTADPTTAATIATDPALAPAASAIAVALAISSDGSKDDLAIASVVQLRHGIFSDAFFADWRTSYDAAACAQAGGVGRTSERQIAGRHILVGSCASGATTYHVHLAGDILVSITSAGPRDLGALVMAGLR